MSGMSAMEEIRARERQIRREAADKRLTLCKQRNGHHYWLLNMRASALAAPGPLTLDQAEKWIEGARVKAHR